jgi:hypothetical protein
MRLAGLSLSKSRSNLRDLKSKPPIPGKPFHMFMHKDIQSQGVWFNPFFGDGGLLIIADDRFEDCPLSQSNNAVYPGKGLSGECAPCLLCLRMPPEISGDMQPSY